VKRVAAAVGEGSMAISFVPQYLRKADAHLSAGRPSIAGLAVDQPRPIGYVAAVQRK
jgi:hypothetical protein